MAKRVARMRTEDRTEELEEALRPFARLAVIDGRMSGMTPDVMRAAVARARTVLGIGTDISDAPREELRAELSVGPEGEQ